MKSVTSDEKICRIYQWLEHATNTSASFHIHNTSLKHIMDKCNNKMQLPFLQNSANDNMIN